MFKRSSGLPVLSNNFLLNPLKLPTDTFARGSINMSDCSKTIDTQCYDKTGALNLKLGAIATIFVTSSLGVLIPLVGRNLRFLRIGGTPFFVAKAFAAGVVLATGFVHMLPDATDALGNSCLPTEPWQKFPWAGFIAMLGALGTLIMDFGATEFYISRHIHNHNHNHNDGMIEKGGDLLVGTDVHNGDPEKQEAGVVMTHPHAHEHVTDEGALSDIRHIVIAQVFEFGIVAHSVIIGITVGVSYSPCSIRPLFAALTFHQFFEGFALGGCIAQAGIRKLSALIMSFFFAITTPLGIAIGIGIASSYNENSPHALIVQGVFDAISAGILVYMALVDLIAADFLSKRMRNDKRLQVLAFAALLAGCGCMSLLGVWA